MRELKHEKNKDPLRSAAFTSREVNVYAQQAIPLSRNAKLSHYAVWEEKHNHRKKTED